MACSRCVETPFCSAGSARRSGRWTECFACMAEEELHKPSRSYSEDEVSPTSPETPRDSVRCQSCGRAVPTAELQEHLDLCGSETPPATPEIRPPPMIACHICGKEFGSKSIERHRSRCEERKAREVRASPRKLAQKPKTITCDICQKEFSGQSIEIHQRQCKKLREQRLRSKSSGLVRARSRKMRSRSTEAPRTGACSLCGKEFLLSSLPLHEQKCRGSERREGVQCQCCGRVFGAKSIEMHEAQCVKRFEVQEKASEKAAKRCWEAESPKDSKAEKGEAPLITVMCHICGRPFSRASIGLHVPKCRQLREERQQQLPADQRSRIVEDLPPLSEVTVDEYNALAVEIYKRITGSEGLGEDPEIEGDVATEAARIESSPRPKPILVVCYVCGRQFGTASIDKHVPRCVKKWESLEAAKPVGERLAALESPKKTAEMTQEEYNQAALAVFQKASQQDDAPHADDLELSPRATSPKRNPYFDHRCHICGKQFGETSMKLHLPRCADRWERRQEQKPVEKRRSIPKEEDTSPRDSESDSGDSATPLAIKCLKCGSSYASEEFHAHECTPPYAFHLEI